MTLHQYGISVFFSQTSFPGEKVGWSQNAGCFLRLSWALRHLTTNVARRFTNLWHIVLSWVENSNWEIENEWLIKCLTNIDWLIDHSIIIDQLIDGWMDEWMVGLIYWLIDWLIDWLSKWFRMNNHISSVPGKGSQYSATVHFNWVLVFFWLKQTL